MSEIDDLDLNFDAENLDWDREGAPNLGPNEQRITAISGAARRGVGLDNPSFSEVDGYHDELARVKSVDQPLAPAGREGLQYSDVVHSISSKFHPVQEQGQIGNSADQKSESFSAPQSNNFYHIDMKAESKSAVKAAAICAGIYGTAVAASAAIPIAITGGLPLVASAAPLIALGATGGMAMGAVGGLTIYGLGRMTDVILNRKGRDVGTIALGLTAPISTLAALGVAAFREEKSGSNECFQ